ncbi:MAG: glycoside hydrolase family 44 protein [Spirosomataceae bacterium]
MKLLFTYFVLFPVIAFCQVTVKIDPKAENKTISPYLYGRNNSFSSTNPNATLSAEDLARIGGAGVQFFRESGGNNCTKYNWRRKLSSHPDWYNNVYTNNWDQTALTIQKNFPKAQGMWAFQLLGMAAKTNQANFNDWGYNQSKWWEGVSQNLAGGGVLNPTGTKAKVEGDVNLYLEKWPADSTVEILDHWFKTLGLNKKQIQYWNMDNEVEIWNGTHDDVMPTQLSAESFIQKYIEVAKKARAKYPDIKLVGPVTANEWQWYNWNNNAVVYEGRNYCWLEFFIKRLADEQKSSGLKLLDVLDLHFYPGSTKAEQLVQYHRVFFDRTYDYPEANGVKRVSGNWDNNQTKEYIFARCNDWLTAYMGANHGVTLGLTEVGIESADANVTAVWYASTMGEFMKNGVELFTPWSWKPGMWEVLHLFSLYNKTTYVKGESSNETLISAYPSLSVTQDSLTVVLVNRSVNSSQTVAITFDNYVLNSSEAKVLTISALPSTETFVSHTQNALQQSKASVTNNTLSVQLPALSVASIQLSGRIGQAPVILATTPVSSDAIRLFPNPADQQLRLEWDSPDIDHLEVIDSQGNLLIQQSVMPATQSTTLSAQLPSGVYVVRLIGKHSVTKKLVVR